MAYKLSIIVPCYNRGQIIQESLPYLRDQVLRHAQDVELIVCNNASTDDTLSILEEMRKTDPYFFIHSYDVHEPEIGKSITRCASQGTGKYVLLWGDDDIPFPFMVDTYLKAIQDYPGVACITANRLLGHPHNDQFSPLVPVENLKPIGTEFSGCYQYYSSANDFIVNHAHQMGFVGVNMFLRSVWSDGIAHYSDAAYGFEFLTPILAGMSGKTALYVSSPVCIQRSFHHPRYMDRWPLYLYAGFPNMLVAVQRAGALKDWHSAYGNYRFVKSTKSCFKNVFNICLKHRDFYRAHVEEFQCFQTIRLRRFAFGLIRLPAWIAFLLRFGWCGYNRIIVPVTIPLWMLLKAVCRLLMDSLLMLRRVLLDLMMKAH